jgi:general secretion pathway protein D
VLRPLVPQQAHMAAYAPSNAIIISDSAANITRIRDIIERMDQSAVQETDVMACATPWPRTWCACWSS